MTGEALIPDRSCRPTRQEGNGHGMGGGEEMLPLLPEAAGPHAMVEEPILLP